MQGGCCTGLLQRAIAEISRSVGIHTARSAHPIMSGDREEYANEGTSGQQLLPQMVAFCMSFNDLRAR